MMEPPNEVALTFGEHLEELRKALISVLLILSLGTLVCLFFHEALFNLLKAPIDTKETPQLALFSPLQGVFLIGKMSFWSGCILTSPFWFYVILRFITPGLRKNEKMLFIPFLAFTFLMILSGILTAYFFTIPIANSYLISINRSLGENIWSLEEYLNYTLFLLFTHAILFELAIILYFLIRQKVFSMEQLTSKRKYVILGAFILGAIFTPPDVFTQILFASFLIAIYELGILYARYRSY